MIKNEPNDIRRYSETLYGIYRGVVVDNDDSSEWSTRFTGGTGRVKVRIFGIHTKETSQTNEEGIPNEDLPWSQPAYPLIEGSLTDYGMWSVPVVGTHVFVFFENGDHMQPRYFACAPGIQPESITGNDESGFLDKDWIRSDRMGEPDYSRAARGVISDTFVENINNNRISDTVEGCDGFDSVQMSESSITLGSYPHILSLETHGGHALTFDSTVDNKKVILYHPSNSWILMYPNGDVSIHSGNSLLSVSMGSRKVYVSGSSERGISGSEKTVTDSDWTVEAAGNIKLRANGIIFEECSGSTMVFNFNEDKHTHTCNGEGNETSEPHGDGWFKV